MKKAILSFIFSLSTLIVLAGGNVKSTTVQGKVIDDEGNPVTGAKVVLLDSKLEAYTDFDGLFSFNNVTTASQKIKVSFVSHEDLVAQIELKNSTRTDLKLEIQSK
ncbi:carboxypeptidase-like regulatory domain-containing protein [Vicingaceae bacterium]|nr:carboxypeptidase-like regulatory domain-containing protein [Vicingaceae bacterium]MDB4060724.1 carboxypeptidase-like regulatory domain-containing protein [Vicingaceae bacterium]